MKLLISRLLFFRFTSILQLIKYFHHTIKLFYSIHRLLFACIFFTKIYLNIIENSSCQLLDVLLANH